MSWLSESLHVAKPFLGRVLLRALVLLLAAVVGEQAEPLEVAFRLLGLS